MTAGKAGAVLATGGDVVRVRVTRARARIPFVAQLLSLRLRLFLDLRVSATGLGSTCGATLLGPEVRVTPRGALATVPAPAPIQAGGLLRGGKEITSRVTCSKRHELK